MKRSKVITAVIAIIAVVAAAVYMDMFAASPPMSRKSLLLPSRRTRPRRKRRTTAILANRPIPRPMNLPYSRKTPIRAARSRSRSTFRMNRVKHSRRPAQTRRDDSDQSLVDALIAAGSLPEGVKVQSSSLENGTLTLDMNAAFGEAIRASGTAGETLKIYALVNTFAQARGATAVLITVDGKVLESGHEIYDYAIEPNN